MPPLYSYTTGLENFWQSLRFRGTFVTAESKKFIRLKQSISNPMHSGIKPLFVLHAVDDASLPVTSTLQLVDGYVKVDGDGIQLPPVAFPLGFSFLDKLARQPCSLSSA